MTRRTPDRTTYIRDGREVGLALATTGGWLAIVPADVCSPVYATRDEAEARVERELEAAA